MAIAEIEAECDSDELRSSVRVVEGEATGGLDWAIDRLRTLVREGQ
jgi:hypothetical protein